MHNKHNTRSTATFCDLNLLLISEALMFKSRVNLLGVQYCAKVLSHSHFFIFSFESGK